MKKNSFIFLFLISAHSSLVPWTHTFHNETDGNLTVVLKYTDLLSTSRENWESAEIPPYSTVPVQVGGACIKQISILGNSESVKNRRAYYDIPVGRNICFHHSYTIKKINNNLSITLDK